MKLSGLPIAGPRFEPWPLEYEADMTVNTKITNYHIYIMNGVLKVIYLLSLTLVLD